MVAYLCSMVCLKQEGRAQHDFSLAWLEATWYSSGSGHGTTGNMPVQEWFCKMCITILPQYWIWEYFSCILTRWRSCRVVLYRTVHLWDSFFEGGCRQWRNSIWYCVNGMLQKGTLENVRTPLCFRILSTSFSSVSIFSVCCYSSVSISMVLSLTHRMCIAQVGSYPLSPLFCTGRTTTP